MKRSFEVRVQPESTFTVTTREPDFIQSSPANGRGAIKSMLTGPTGSITRHVRFPLVPNIRRVRVMNVVWWNRTAPLCVY
jgi:hypothetical protein